MYLLIFIVLLPIVVLSDLAKKYKQEAESMSERKKELLAGLAYLAIIILISWLCCDMFAAGCM